MQHGTSPPKFPFRLLVGLASLLVLGGLGLGLVVNVMKLRSRSETNAQAIIQSWCRLAPLPDNLAQANWETGGNSFTRSFTYQFTADADQLEQWVAASPGLQTARIETADRTMRYIVQPDAAAWCEVKVQLETNYVWIYTYWS